jgi:hypothetical protein
MTTNDPYWRAQADKAAMPDYDDAATAADYGPDAALAPCGCPVRYLLDHAAHQEGCAAPAAEALAEVAAELTAVLDDAMAHHVRTVHGDTDYAALAPDDPYAYHDDRYPECTGSLDDARAALAEGRCPVDGTSMTIGAAYGAPGVGHAARCQQDHPYAYVGGCFYYPEDGAHILDPEDVI